MISKSASVARLRHELDELTKVPEDRTDRSGAFERWHRAARVAVEHTFGDTSKQAQEFSRIGFYPVIVTHATTESDRQSAFTNGLKRAKLLIESLLEEIEEYWPDDDSSRVSTREEHFDVCLSFAGEDRPYVDAVAQSLKSLQVNAFYDMDEQVELWGKDLYQHFDEVYRKRAGFCVLFISRAYAAKRWTKHELQSAQARAFEENQEYLLPARFDDTEIPGVRKTIGYIDLRNLSPERFAQLIAKKIESRYTRSHSSPPPELTRGISGSLLRQTMPGPNVQPIRPWFMGVSVGERGILREDPAGPLKALVAPFRNDPTFDVPNVSTAARLSATVALEAILDFRVTGYWMGSSSPFISFAPGEQWLLIIAILDSKLASLVADNRRSDGGGSLELKHFWAHPTTTTETTAAVTIANDGVLVGRFRYELKITPAFPNIVQLPID